MSSAVLKTKQDELMSIESLFTKPFWKRSDSEQISLLKAGRPRPKMRKLVNHLLEYNIKAVTYFCESQYDIIPWLTGSETKNQLFCWPCLLFCKAKMVWNHKGYIDIVNLETNRVRHESSIQHISSEYKRLTTEKKYGLRKVETSDRGSRNSRMKSNRQLLKRPTDVIRFVATQLKPVQESSDPVDYVAYSELLLLIATYDPPLHNHLQASLFNQVNCPDVKNNLISAIAEVMREHIKKELIDAPGASLQFNEKSETIDKSEVATTIRFCKGTKIQERFIGFYNLPQRNSDNFFSLINNIVRNLGIQDKFTGYSINGTLLSEGHYSALKNKISVAFPMAIFITMHEQDFTTLILEGTSIIPKCNVFYKILNNLTKFLKNQQMSPLIEEFLLGRLGHKSWDFDTRLLDSLIAIRGDLSEFFDDIVEQQDNWDSLTVLKAGVFKRFLTDAETLKLLEIFSRMFRYSKDMEKTFKDFRVSYLKRKEQLGQIEAMLDKPNLEVVTGEPPLKKSCIPDVSPLHQEIVHRSRNILNNRFDQLNRLSFIALFDQSQYPVYKANFPDTLLHNLKLLYGDTFFDYVKLRNELIVVYTTPMFSKRRLHNILQVLDIYSLNRAFKQLVKLIQCLLSLPLFPPSSQLNRRVDSFKTLSTSEQRSSVSSLLMVEKQLLLDLASSPSFYEDVISKMSKQNEQLIELNDV